MASSERKKDVTTRHWQDLLAESVVSPAPLNAVFGRDLSDRSAVIVRYPMRINPYYLSLIRDPDDALGRQAVPDLRELEGPLTADPLDETGQSPVPNLIHRYPDRVVFLVSDTCAMFCRHCMRKRSIGRVAPIPPSDTLAAGIDYIRRTPAVRDVILSGGDPLMLPTETLDKILTGIRKARHVEIIRIHSRMPCTLPMRITDRLVRMIARHHPVFVNTHFNHPDEITPQAARACARLADAGIPLGCQTVLLKGVNDDPAVMQALMRKLLTIRVRPYYLHHPDPVAGTAHFRPSVETGLAVIRGLRGHTSGMAVPHYVIDLPGGKGKVPLSPYAVSKLPDNMIRVENYLGDLCDYPL
ncbi:KamA family radical SAM protein [Desulfatiferula olefinivorans]